ncbi:MAG: acyl-CoA thioesterase [Deltaproteobacteria bacterium]|jgi:thioesterase-3|nr:acyl-CoA thioesterase [Deltaproteobacteria bacterium]
MKFEYEVLIRESHIDSFGHVNNAQYLSLFEEARWEIITPRGFSVGEIQARGLGPVVLEVNLRFSKEIQLRQKIRIRSEVIVGPNAMRSKTSKMIQIMVNEKDENCCTGEFTFALFDLRARRIVPPTAEWLNAIGVT